MDISGFNARFSSLINSGGFKGKGVEAEGIKKDRGITPQTGPKADTVEINFGKLDEVTNNPGSNPDVAKIVGDISNMSMEDAQATFKNPTVFKTLVEAGVLE